MNRRTLFSRFTGAVTALVGAKSAPAMIQRGEQSVSEYKGWTIKWTGWKDSQSTINLVGQFAAYRKLGEGHLLYVSLPGTAGLYRCGMDFTILPTLGQQTIYPDTDPVIAAMERSHGEDLMRCAIDLYGLYAEEYGDTWRDPEHCENALAYERRFEGEVVKLSNLFWEGFVGRFTEPMKSAVGPVSLDGFWDIFLRGRRAASDKAIRGSYDVARGMALTSHLSDQALQAMIKARADFAARFPEEPEELSEEGESWTERLALLRRRRGL